MTDAEMVKAMEICKDEEIPCDDCPLAKCGDCGEISRQYFYDRFKQLQSENAALHERLAHSLELPYMEQTVSQYGTEDTVLYYMENGKLQQECFNNKFPEQLQARLAELNGGKNE